MQMSLKGSPISLCQLMGLTEQNTVTGREVRRPGARSPLLQFATGSSLSREEAKPSLPSLRCPDVFERGLCSRDPESQQWGPFAHCSSWHLGVLSGWTTFSRCPSRVVRIQESIRLRWGSNCTQLIHLQRQPLVIKGVFKVTWQTDFFFPPELVNKLHIMP